jgi:GntR family transcriptional regulator, transcriptional repressor for pyruvate dehydrogenase complex
MEPMMLDISPTFVRERLYEQVADYIEDLVSSGELRPGDKLPPERELAETLRVARGVVREAVKVLAVRGLVTVKPGLGTYISEVSADAISGHLDRYFRLGNQSHSDLIELRQILEVEFAALAAQRAQPQDLQEMHRAVAEMDLNIDRAQAYIDADQTFHLAIARAARNEMFPLLIEAVAGYLEASRLMIFKVPGAPQRGQAWHRKLCEAIEQHDAAGARQAMREHMTQVAEDVQAAGPPEQLPGKGAQNGDD